MLFRPLSPSLICFLPYLYLAPSSGRQRTQKAPKAKPSLVRRVSTLANTLSRHTMQTTAWALKQGHSLAMWIPGVAPLVSVCSEFPLALL